MQVTKDGYVQGVVLLSPTIKKMREILETEKFQCRILVDNETTQTFKIKTDSLNNQLYALRYNNPESIKMTVAGKKTNGS